MCISVQQMKKTVLSFRQHSFLIWILLINHYMRAEFLNTDAEYLLDAMKDTPEFSFSGYESQYGLTLTTINGITADWDKDNAFWCIYVNGEMGNYGVETQPVADGDVFLFEYAGLNGNA